MKNRLIISILTVCFLLSPFCVFAQSAESNPDAAANALYAVGEIADEARVTFDYEIDAQKTPDGLPQVSCRAVYLADPVSGKVFFEKNAHQKMYPASTTKLLTALLVLENCSMDETAVVSPKAVSAVPAGYVTANLRPGESFSIYTLLQALLIPSANEAAFVLAEHVSGSTEAFAERCNQRAEELGCEMLHFVNPNGIHDENHYCSAYDLYLIAKECRKFKVFNEIVKTKSFTVPATAIYPASDRTYQNTNKLLFPSSSTYYAACTGMKTGYTPAAGECLVGSSTDNKLNLISVVLGGTVRGGVSERFSDTTKLFTFVYDNYVYRKIADKTVSVAQIEVSKATKKTKNLDVVIQTNIATVVPKNITKNNVPVKTDLPEELKAPIQENQVLGTVTYSADGLVYTTNLVAQHAVKKNPYWLYNLLVLLAVIVIAFVILEKRQEQKRRRQRAQRARQRNRRPMQ